MALSEDQERLILEYLPLAQKEAVKIWKTAPHVLDVEELKSIAYLGLVSAAVRWNDYCREHDYDVRAEQYFYKFSKLRIKGAIIDALRQSDWATRSLRAKSRRLREAGQDQGATVREMSEQSGMSESEVSHTIHGMSQRPVSIEAEEIDYAVVQSIEASVLVSYLLSVLVEVVSRLSPMCQVILALHYFENRELQDISKILGITEHRSSQLHTESVIRIRQSLADAAAGKGYDMDLGA